MNNINRSAILFDADKPSDWFIEGEHQLLNVMLNKAKQTLKNKYNITLFINFTNKNIQLSNFNIKNKFITVALCENNYEYNMIQYCYNLYNESFDVVINLEKIKKYNEIFNIIYNVIYKKYNIIMKKFDCIIMNPPFNKKLHLEILAEAIKHLKDDNSVCVNLSPVRWLQDPFALYKRSELKKFESEICKKIITIDSIKNELASKLFNIAIYANLGIYTCKNNNTNFNYKNYWKDNKNNTEINVIEKCCLSFKTKNLEDELCSDSMSGVCVPIALIAGGRGTLPIFKNYSLIVNNMINNEDWVDVWNKDPKHRAFQKQKNSTICHIKFNTIQEAENFYKSYQTIFLRYVCNITVQQQHIQFKFLPFLGDAINPRTGLKGYEGEWTDDDLYKFFNITPEEQKIIEETMEKYK